MTLSWNSRFAHRLFSINVIWWLKWSELCISFYAFKTLIIDLSLQLTSIYHYPEKQKNISWPFQQLCIISIFRKVRSKTNHLPSPVRSASFEKSWTGNITHNWDQHSYITTLVGQNRTSKLKIDNSSTRLSYLSIHL